MEFKLIKMSKVNLVLKNPKTHKLRLKQSQKSSNQKWTSKIHLKILKKDKHRLMKQHKINKIINLL